MRGKINRIGQGLTTCFESHQGLLPGSFGSQTLCRNQWCQIRAFNGRQTELSEYTVDRGERYFARRRDLDSNRFPTSAEVHNGAGAGKHGPIAL